MSSNKWGFSDESFDNHFNPWKTSVLGLDYVLRDLKVGGDGLECKDDVCSSELAVAMEEDLGSQDSVEVSEVYQDSSLSSGLFI